MCALVSPSPSQREGFLHKRTGFPLKSLHRHPLGEHFPASTLPCTSFSLFGTRNGESRGLSVLQGSQAVLVPPQTCLPSRLNSPNISCLFSHRNVSVITLFSCSLTFLDAGAAQDVPNLAGCPSSAGGTGSHFPVSSFVKAQHPQDEETKKSLQRGAVPASRDTGKGPRLPGRLVLRRG